MFGWFNLGLREQRKKVRLDRKHLAARSRRFLRNYLNCNDKQKRGYYRVVGKASMECQPKSSSPDATDAEIAQATSDTALTIVLERVQQRKNDRADDFVTDAFATVAVAYRRAAGLYSADKTMQELGTAAVHLLTIATSYDIARTSAVRTLGDNFHDKDGASNDRRPV